MTAATRSTWLGIALAAALACGTAGCEAIEEWYGTDDDISEDAPAPSDSSPAPEAESGSGVASADTGSGIAPPGPMQGIWRYTDKKGVIHYVDSIKKVPKRYRKRAIHPEGGSYTIVPATPVDDLLEKDGLDANEYAKKGPAKIKKHGQVILYSTSWCPYCTKAANHLRKRGVAFVTKDVGKSRDNLKEMLSKSGGARGVPVVDVYGKVIRGYSPQAMDQALGR